MWELGGRINEGNRSKQRITHEAKERKHQRQFLTFWTCQLLASKVLKFYSSVVALNRFKVLD